MSSHNGHHSNCSIATALSVLGDKWTLLIARDIMMGNQNFESIQNNLNISRNLLTERLKTMTTNKLIKRFVPNNKKRALYVPTQRCNDLVKIFLSLSLWADRWIPDTKRPRMAILGRFVSGIHRSAHRESDRKILTRSLHLCVGT